MDVDRHQKPEQRCQHVEENGGTGVGAVQSRGDAGDEKHDEKTRGQTEKPLDPRGIPISK